MSRIYISNRIISVGRASAHVSLWSAAVVISQSGGSHHRHDSWAYKNLITATHKEFKYYGVINATTTGRC